MAKLSLIKNLQVLRILEGLTETDNRTEKLLLPDAAPELLPVALVEEKSDEEELFIQQKSSVKRAENSTTISKIHWKIK